MPGQRHPDKTTLSVYLPRVLMQKLRRLAIGRGVSVTAVVEEAVLGAVRGVELTDDDLAQIAREKRAALRMRGRHRRS